MNGIMPIGIVAGVLLVLVPGSGIAQDREPRPPEQASAKPKNSVEEFVSRKGVLLVKKMYGIKTFTWGSGGDDRATLAVSAMHAYEADKKNQGVLALRFEGQPRLGVPISALLDPTSARSLLAALETMIALSRENASTTPDFLEVQFALGDSFLCGFNQQGTLQRPFIILGADVSRTIRSSRMADLEDLKTAVAEEIEKLKELGGN